MLIESIFFTFLAYEKLLSMHRSLYLKMIKINRKKPLINLNLAQKNFKVASDPTNQYLSSLCIYS